MASLTLPELLDVTTIEPEITVRALELARHYGEGDTAVHALRGNRSAAEAVALADSFITKHVGPR